MDGWYVVLAIVMFLWGFLAGKKYIIKKLEDFCKTLENIDTDILKSNEEKGDK